LLIAKSNRTKVLLDSRYVARVLQTFVLPQIALIQQLQLQDGGVRLVFYQIIELFRAQIAQHAFNVLFSQNVELLSLGDLSVGFLYFFGDLSSAFGFKFLEDVVLV